MPRSKKTIPPPSAAAAAIARSMAADAFVHVVLARCRKTMCPKRTYVEHFFFSASGWVCATTVIVVTLGAAGDKGAVSSQGDKVLGVQVVGHGDRVLPGWMLSGRLNHALHFEELLVAEVMVMALLVPPPTAVSAVARRKQPPPTGRFFCIRKTPVSLLSRLDSRWVPEPVQRAAIVRLS